MKQQVAAVNSSKSHAINYLDVTISQYNDYQIFLDVIIYDYYLYMTFPQYYDYQIYLDVIIKA